MNYTLAAERTVQGDKQFYIAEIRNARYLGEADIILNYLNQNINQINSFNASAWSKSDLIYKNLIRTGEDRLTQNLSGVYDINLTMKYTGKGNKNVPKIVTAHFYGNPTSLATLYPAFIMHIVNESSSPEILEYYKIRSAIVSRDFYAE